MLGNYSDKMFSCKSCCGKNGNSLQAHTCFDWKWWGPSWKFWKGACERPQFSCLRNMGAEVTAFPQNHTKYVFCSPHSPPPHTSNSCLFLGMTMVWFYDLTFVSRSLGANREFLMLFWSGFVGPVVQGLFCDQVVLLLRLDTFTLGKQSL